MAVDDDTVPKEAVGAFTLAFRSNRQLLDYAPGQKLDPAAPILRADAARSFYMALNPPKRGGTAVTAVTADFPGYNCLFTGSGLVWTLDNVMGDGFTVSNLEGVYHPRMIKRVPSLANGLIKKQPDGGYSITYELRKGMKWHDGAPVTAKDAKFQWEVMTSSAPVTASYYEKNVAKVEVKDDYTFTTYLKEAVGSMELGSSVYGYYYGWFQIPEHLFRADFESAKKSGKWEAFVDKVNKNPVMAGPYKFKEYKEGQYLVLEAFDDYYMGRPNVDRIVFRIIKDQDVVFASILKGEVDFGRYTLPFKESLQLQKDKGDLFDVTFTESVANQCVFVNFSDPADPAKPHPILSDLKVRQALLSAINRDQINQMFYQGKTSVPDTWITSIHFQAAALKSPLVRKYPYDQAKAKELLAQAGWKANAAGVLEKDGKPFEISLAAASGSADSETLAMLIQGMLKQVGVTVKIELKPAQVVWSETLPQRKFDMMLSGWGYGLADEAKSYFGTEAIPTAKNSWAGNNFMGWSNAENDKIMDEALREVDPTKKGELYAKHFGLWTEALPYYPLVVDPTPHFAKRSLRSYSSGYECGFGWRCYDWYYLQ